MFREQQVKCCFDKRALRDVTLRAEPMQPRAHLFPRVEVRLPSTFQLENTEVNLTQRRSRRGRRERERSPYTERAYMRWDLTEIRSCWIKTSINSSPSMLVILCFITPVGDPSLNRLSIISVRFDSLKRGSALGIRSPWSRSSKDNLLTA